MFEFARKQATVVGQGGEELWSVPLEQRRERGVLLPTDEEWKLLDGGFDAVSRN